MSTEKLRFLGECSTEALLQIFDPKTTEGLRVPLDEYILRMIAVELIAREQPTNEAVLKALAGPEFCSHDRHWSKHCSECDPEEDEELDDPDDQ